MEHDWVAETGSYVFEPPGETHTLVLPDDCPEMITLFHIIGVMVYVDRWGKQTGYEDDQNKADIASAIVRKWFDVDGVTAVADGASSAAALGVREAARQRHCVFLISGAT
jgi:Periplasmic binding protein